MSSPRRRFRLFPRSMQDVVKDATAPMMKKEGKLYGALLRDWVQIIGPERAAYLKPERIQFARGENADGAVLHLSVASAKAPEMTYEEAQVLESLARYFGYRAIARLVLHASHDFDLPNDEPAPQATASTPIAPLPEALPSELRAVFARMQKHVVAKDGKQD